MTFETAVLGSRSLTVPTVCEDIRQNLKKKKKKKTEARSRGGRPRLPAPNSPYSFCGRKATFEEEEKDRNQSQELCENRGGRPGIPVPNNSPTVSVDVKQHLKKKKTEASLRSCENRGGRPGLPVPNIPYRLCGSKATLTSNSDASWPENVGHNYVEMFPPAGFTFLLCQ